MLFSLRCWCYIRYQQGPHPEFLSVVKPVEPSLTPKMESFINFANLRKHKMSDLAFLSFRQLRQLSNSLSILYFPLYLKLSVKLTKLNSLESSQRERINPHTDKEAEMHRSKLATPAQLSGSFGAKNYFFSLLGYFTFL